uniref:Uncharacterized protein n=1 Tax=Panagrolaimus sp. ES5 TaxID=591445 RepID=A0AC34FVR6_9BILA
MGSAPTISGTPQIQSDKKPDTPRRNKKAIKTSKFSNTNNNHNQKAAAASKRSKREKSKEEKTKKESNLKKFLHKFGGSEKKDTKTQSFEEAPPEGQNDENDKVPISSRKAARRRKMLGDNNNFKTAEDGDLTNTQAEEEAKIVDPVKVVQMGNIDIITQQEKNKRIREIEQMPSGNYCEEPTQLSKSVKKEHMHVKIVEQNCKLYETNAEPITRSFKESLRRRKKIKHQLRPRSKGSDSK